MPPYCLEFTTAVRALCHQWQAGPRVKYVPTDANPADKPSCGGTSPYIPVFQTPGVQAWSASSGPDPAIAQERNVVFVLVMAGALRGDLTSGFPLDEPAGYDSSRLAEVPRAAVSPLVGQFIQRSKAGV